MNYKKLHDQLRRALASVESLMEEETTGRRPLITFHTTPWDSALKLAEDLGDDAIVLDLRPFSLLEKTTCQFLSPEEFRVSFVTKDCSTERDQVIREYRDRLSILTEEEIKDLLLKLVGKKVVIPFPFGTAGKVFHALFDVFLAVLCSRSEMNFKVIDTRPMYPRPRYTVVYNIVSPESSKWIGTGWEFFDNKKDAEECNRRHIENGNVPMLRPFYERPDRERMGAAHRMRATHR